MIYENINLIDYIVLFLSSPLQIFKVTVQYQEDLREMQASLASSQQANQLLKTENTALLAQMQVRDSRSNSNRPSKVVVFLIVLVLAVKM